MALSAQITLNILAHETSSGDLSRTLRATPASYALSLADGTGANQAQVVWSDSRTVTTTPEDLNLAALPDTRDGAAVVVAFTQVKMVYVRNTHATESLRIGGWAGFGGFLGLPSTVYMGVPPGGVYLLTNPTAGGWSGGNPCNARFAADSGTCTYDIILIGEGSVT